MQEIFELVKTVGLPTALVIYFVWQNSKTQKTQEEDRKIERKAQEEKFASLEVFCREELLNTSKDVAATNKYCIELINDTRDNMGRTKEVLHKVVASYDKNNEVLKECMDKMERLKDG